VHIEPLGIYSHKHKDFSSLPENATVAVPNNTTNLSRALFLLQAQKLIKLDPNLPTRPPPWRRRRILSRTRNT
jgi:D-methionine transport system substrate-binding protein